MANPEPIKINEENKEELTKMFLEELKNPSMTFTEKQKEIIKKENADERMVRICYGNDYEWWEIIYWSNYVPIKVINDFKNREEAVKFTDTVLEATKDKIYFVDVEIDENKEDYSEEIEKQLAKWK